MSLDTTRVDTLTYLITVCNEVLQLYPIVPNICKVVTASNTVIGKTKIPVGTHVIVSP